MRAKTLFLLLLLALQGGLAQKPQVTRVEPPNWWPGMKLNRIQLMVYGEGLDRANVSSSFPGVRVLGVHPTGNPSFLFVNLELAPTAVPGNVRLRIATPTGATTLSYPLLPRPNPDGRYQGFTCADVIYLITSRPVRRWGSFQQFHPRHA